MVPYPVIRSTCRLVLQLICKWYVLSHRHMYTFELKIGTQPSRHHGWEIAVILRNFRKTKLSKFFFSFFLKLYFNIHTMCNSTTFALRHTQISLSSILRHFQPPSRHLLLNTHDTNMEFLQLSGPLLDSFLFFSKTKIYHSHPCDMGTKRGRESIAH